MLFLYPRFEQAGDETRPRSVERFLMKGVEEIELHRAGKCRGKGDFPILREVRIVGSSHCDGTPSLAKFSGVIYCSKNSSLTQAAM